MTFLLIAGGIVLYLIVGAVLVGVAKGFGVIEANDDGFLCALSWPVGLLMLAVLWPVTEGADAIAGAIQRRRKRKRAALGRGRG